MPVWQSTWAFCRMSLKVFEMNRIQRSLNKGLNHSQVEDAGIMHTGSRRARWSARRMSEIVSAVVLTSEFMGLTGRKGMKTIISRDTQGMRKQTTSSSRGKRVLPARIFRAGLALLVGFMLPLGFAAGQASAASKFLDHPQGSNQRSPLLNAGPRGPSLPGVAS